MHPSPRSAVVLFTAAWAAAFLLIYAPLVGHGFLLDDFAWIRGSAEGFYRPVVEVSFALNRAAYGLWARGYGVTNLLLALACAAAVASLARATGLERTTSVTAAALWAFNPHGINMGLLWISGRTSLMATLFSAAAARVALGKTPSHLLCAALVLLALLSKEEALPLPLMIAAALVFAGGPAAARRRRRVRVTALVAPLVVYAILRAQSDAFLPGAAPEHYRYTASPSVLLRNAGEYADRAATFSAACVLLAFATVRRGIAMTETQRNVVRVGVSWAILAFLTTIALPVRSSLYVCLPSVGVAIAAAAIIEGLARQATTSQRRALAALALILPIALWPVYSARAQRWVRPAVLSSETLGAVRQLPCLPSAPDYLLFLDDRGARANLSNAFGGLLPDALELATGRAIPWKAEPPMASAYVDERATGRAVAVLKVAEGDVSLVSHECR